MDDSLGKKLEAARVKKQMTIEDVARVTKIRPHSIAELERDDYSNFPSLAYAKGFVILYAKYLGVDVNDINNVFGNPNEFGMSDYEYLSHTVENEGTKPHRAETERSRGGSKATIIILIILIIVGGAFYYGAQFLLKVQRLDSNGKPIPAASASPSPSTSSLASALKAASTHSATPEEIRRATLVVAPTPTPASTPQISATPIPTPSAPPAPSSTPAPTVIIRRAVPVFPSH